MKFRDRLTVEEYIDHGTVDNLVVEGPSALETSLRLDLLGNNYFLVNNILLTDGTHVFVHELRRVLNLLYGFFLNSIYELIALFAEEVYHGCLNEELKHNQ